MSIVMCGLDLAQVQDFTALVGVEVKGTMLEVPGTVREPITGLEVAHTWKVEAPPITRLDIRYVERFQQNTPYLAMCEAVGDRIRRMPRPKFLVVDQTGVGRGVVEMLEPLKPFAVTITAGHQVTQGDHPREWKVPKRDLVAALQVASQGDNRRLRMAANLPHGQLLLNELLNFRAKVTAAGSETFGAWREGDHDDLVLAAALAVWGGKLVLEYLAAGQIEALRRGQQPSYRIDDAD